MREMGQVMIEAQDWQSISKILFQLYSHPEGLSLPEISRLTGLEPVASANYLFMLDQLGAYVGIFSEEDEWDGECDYIEYLVQSPQRWFFNHESGSKFPVEFDVEELMVLAQFAQFAGQADLVSKISDALGQTPFIDSLQPSLGKCLDRNWDTIVEALQAEKEVFISSNSTNAGLKRKRVIPLAVVHNRDTGFWYLIGSWRKSACQFRLDKLDRVEIGQPVAGGLPPFDLEQYVGSSWGLMRGREEKVEALFKDEGRVLTKAFARIRERPKASWQRHKDGRQLYSDSVAGVEEMLPWFRAFGSSVEVIRPKWVRERLLAEARQIMRYYSAGVDEQGK